MSSLLELAPPLPPPPKKPKFTKSNNMSPNKRRQKAKGWYQKINNFEISEKVFKNSPKS
jgi:hypothetical protein